jgi:predicted  nucleic acid-binding Zn-ribbon protein
MPKPEIARRCSVCGASIRDAALFCPQCGEHLVRQNPEDKPTTSVVTTPLVELLPDHDEAKDNEVPAESEPQKLDTVAEPATPPKQIPADRAPVGKVRDKIQRATTLARDVEGDVKHRVQKVRQISSVVLDEAGYDPSLRFVLVAAALFLLFLLVLLLNKLIT